MPAPFTTAKNTHYGKFATTSRLIACLVTEGLVPGHFVPNPNIDNNNGDVVGLCILPRIQGSSEPPEHLPSTLRLDDLLAIVPLRGMPEMNHSSVSMVNGVRCTKVELVDPWDMLPHIYAPRQHIGPDVASSDVLEGSQVIRKQVNAILKSICLMPGVKEQEWLVDGYDAVQLWKQFAKDYGVQDKLSEQLASELASSIVHQVDTYDHPKPLPNLQSPAYQWEQSIVEGHATHPMHKARKSFPPMPPLNPGQVNLTTPKLRLFAIPRSSMNIRGDFEELCKPLVDAMLAKSGDGATMLRSKYRDHVFFPAHELQIPNIQSRFEDAKLLPEEVNITVQSLTSIRSVAIPEVLKGYSVKLCLGIKVSSALRTVTPFTTYFGPGFSANVVPKLSYDRKVLTVERELASITYRHPDTDVAKHCSCVIREAVEYEESNLEANGDAIIVAAALVEKIQKPDTDETLVTHVWGLDTEERRAAFLDRYIELAFRAFLPPCLENGVAFEAHGQNTMCRFDRKTGELKGFVVRDFGGVKVHNETLKKSCGVELDVLPDSCVVAHSLDECYKLLYHTLIHSQLQRLIRVLGMHHNGRGWEMVRKHFKAMVPKGHPMWAYLMGETKVPGKCLVRMKIEELYRDYIYRPVPNMIHSRPQHLVKQEI